jgi:hypothetical protein
MPGDLLQFWGDGIMEVRVDEFIFVKCACQATSGNMVRLER